MIQDKGVVKGFYKEKLMIWLIVVLVLLCSCIAYDYAENNTITNIESTGGIIDSYNVTVVNNTTVIGVNESASNIVVKSSDKIYTSKAKTPTITMTGKPSCQCGRYSSYTLRTRTYIDYCPHCHRYGVLYNAHKYPARFEQEITCRHCGADYCINCGHEKYSWSNYYLTKERQKKLNT